jgi:GNAT superfamily N-acetyltransferase
MIRPCSGSDFNRMLEIINDAARAYRGVIPADRWKEPYMPADELSHEIDDGVVFWGCEEGGSLIGIMGIQDAGDATLIRHAYVATEFRGKGIGSLLLAELAGKSDRALLIGTWADASWAVRFYEKHGFRKVSTEDKDLLLRKYWKIPERQVETSVVLADTRFSAGAHRQ